VQAITPNDRFYVVTKNVIDPRVEKALWRLEVTGRVDRPHSYTFEELAALPSTTQETTLMCISNAVGGGLISNALWKGTPLPTLLSTARPQPGVVEVVFHAVDGYTDTIPFEKAMDPTTFVAYEMNGAPLPDRHGHPVRILVPGEYGEKNVKWVTQIELVDQEIKGFYEKQGWGPDFVIPTRSRFDFPNDHQSFKLPVVAAQPIVVKGTAFAGDRGVARVEISFDNAKSWQAARLDYPGSRLSWALWSYDWRPAGPGDYRLVVRATDRTGAIQTAAERGSVPSGATGYHRIMVRIEP
jgi:DMSO/TMAO reductase YedYZ molybdopterin-dependent catalytic subunit